MWRVPIGWETPDSSDSIQLRKNDSVFSGNSHNALRARQRLVAVLPFEWDFHSGGLQLNAQLVANPHAEQPRDLEEFKPLPRFVVTDESELQFRPTHYQERFKNDDEPLWSYTP